MVQPGTTLAGRYRLGERLGRGGMAEVFRARDTVLGRDVAVKVLAAHLVGDAPAHRRFRREARAAASQRHPNIVQVHDAGTDGDVEFLVMELVEGETLHDRIQRDGPLPLGEALDVANQLCAALAAAHADDIVHRDVKPGNVMFQHDGTVKVTDFGLARLLTQTSTMTATVYGSAPYVAPEQARGDGADRRTDLYAVGCVLMEMLTGKPPFTGDSPMSIIYQHLHDPPPRPSSRQPDVPPALDAVVLRALAKDPADRYQTVDDLLVDLAAIDGPAATAPVLAPPATQRLGDETIAITVAGGGASTRPLSDPVPADEAPRRVRPRRWRSVALTAVVVLGGIAALTAVDGSDRPEAAAPPTTAPPTNPVAVETPPETAPPSPTAGPATVPPPANPDEAYSQVRALVDEASAAGALDGDAADKIQDKVDESYDEHLDGKPEEAVKKVEDARKEVTKAQESGLIEAATAAALQDRLTELQRQYVSHPVAGDDDGPGRGRGRGNDDDDD